MRNTAAPRKRCIMKPEKWYTTDSLKKTRSKLRDIKFAAQSCGAFESDPRGSRWMDMQACPHGALPAGINLRTCLQNKNERKISVKNRQEPAVSTQPVPICIQGNFSGTLGVYPLRSGSDGGQNALSKNAMYKGSVRLSSWHILPCRLRMTGRCRAGFEARRSSALY